MSRKLYEISQDLIDTIEYEVDTDSGEILEGDDLNERIAKLNMELNDKIEGCGLYSKQLDYDIDAFDQEIDKLKKRKEQTIKKQNGINRFLSTYLLNNGFEKGFETTRVKIKFRKSTQVNVVNQDIVPKEFIKTKTKVEENVDKAGIKDFLKKNPDKTINGVELLTVQNMKVE